MIAVVFALALSAAATALGAWAASPREPVAATSLRTAFAIALLMALGGVLSACGFSNTFNYGHGQGACENCGGF